MNYSPPKRGRNFAENQLNKDTLVKYGAANYTRGILMENTKKWSKAFIYIGYISIALFLLVTIRIKIGFEYPSQQQYYLTLTNIKFILLILAPFSLMIGYAIKSIFTEVLRIFRNSDNKTKKK